jgi:hypothetical protein
MDEAFFYLYFPVALLSVGWSFWAHSLWEGHAGLKDDSGVRTWSLVAGPTWFFLLAFIGSGESLLPLDLMGMVSLGVILVLGGLGFLIVSLIKKGKHIPFLWVFWSVQAASLIVLVLQVLAANSPYVAAWLAGWGQFLLQLFEGRGWDLLTPLDEAGNLNLQLDKIFLAVLSYLPITGFRILYTQHLHRRLKKEMAKLIVRVERLEKIQKKEKDV